MEEIRVRDAIIEEIFTERGTTFITIRYGNPSVERVTLIVNRDTRITDENGRRISARELREGFVIDATFSETMTRSIPPQSQAFRIRVVSRPREFDITIGRILQVNPREQFITTISTPSRASIIRFNVTPETRILDLFGRPIGFNRLVPGLRVRVEHANFMTASIPPQSPAFVIRVIR